MSESSIGISLIKGQSLLFHVSFSVTLQGTGLIEGLLTSWARVRPGSCVDPLVAIEVREMGEVLTTGTAMESNICDFIRRSLPAHIRFDAEMNPFVVLQVVQLEEGFRAQLTLVTSLGKVIPLDMVTEDGGEFVLLLTELAGKHCLVILMHLLYVSVQGAFPRKSLTTLVAGMFSEARRVQPHMTSQVGFFCENLFTLQTGELFSVCQDFRQALYQIFWVRRRLCRVLIIIPAEGLNNPTLQNKLNGGG